MRYKVKSVMMWLGAVLAFIVLVASAAMIWSAHARKVPSSPTATIPQKEIAIPGSRLTDGKVSQVAKLLPGDTCERATELYGKPTEKDEYGGTWETQDLKVFVGANSKCVITGIDVEVKSDHHAITLDGIRLGVDTVADAERILQPRINGDSESVEAPEGNWDAMISIGPTTNFPYQTIYRAKLDAKMVDQLNRDPVFDDFRGRFVTEYSLDSAAPVQSTK